MGGRYPANASRKPQPVDFPRPAPGPANDNIKLPRPANDNKPRRPRARSVPKVARLFRQHPAQRAIDIAEQVYGLYLRTRPAEPVPAGWARSWHDLRYGRGTSIGTVTGSTSLPDKTNTSGPVRSTGAVPAGHATASIIYQYRTYWAPMEPQHLPYRWAAAETYVRTVANAPWPDRVISWEPVIEPVAVPMTPRPNPYPQINPERTPIYEPAPTPRPIPYRALPRVRPYPRYRPGDRPRIMPGLPIYPNPGSRPLPDVVVTPRPRPDGITNPSLEITPSGMRATKPHLSRRPPKGTKERKFAIAARGVAMSIVGVVGEAVDVIDALHDALPEKYKARSVCGGGRYDVAGSYKLQGPRGSKGCKGPTPQAKLKALYNHIGKIDIGSAMGNLAYELVEDYAYGRMGQAFARDNRRAGRSAGLLLGPAL